MRVEQTEKSAEYMSLAATTHSCFFSQMFFILPEMPVVSEVEGHEGGVLTRTVMALAAAAAPRCSTL